MSIQRFAKAIAPAFLSLVGTVAYSLANGTFDRTSIVIAGVGLVGAAVTYFVPNAGPEVQAAEALFSPVTAGRPDPPAPPVAAPAPVAPAPPVAS